MARLDAIVSALLLIALPSAPAPARANQPPAPPTWIEPQPGAIVSAFDPHLNVNAFVDPDSGDTHAESDFEIWDDSLNVRAWAALGITDPALLYHVHFGDGVPEGPLAGETRLDFDRPYRTRARFRDSSGEPNSWSDWSAWVPFRTAPAAQIFPMVLEDLLATPPAWTTEDGADLELPPGGFLLLEGGGAPLLMLEGTIVGNLPTDFPPLGAHEPLRLTYGAYPPDGFSVPPSRLTVVDDDSLSRDIYLPEMTAEPGAPLTLWVDDRGRTYFGDPSDSIPDFSRLAQDVFTPWAVATPGFHVERVVSNLFLPVNIAFAEPRRAGPRDPFFYVTELYGKVKVVTNDLSVFTYAEGLLNFEPTGDFPGSGEMGITGLCVDPESGDLFVTGVYDDGGWKYNRVMRLESAPDGLSAESMSVILSGIPSAPSHQIQEASIGPDGKLYVQVADGAAPDTTVPQDPADLRGKTLRMNLDGSPPGDNPYGPKSLVWAVGFRNPFGGDWSPSGRLFVSDNGPDANDRVARVAAGGDYGWCCDMTQGALALYPNAGITGLAVAPAGAWGDAYKGNVFVGFSGPTYAPGDPGGNAKRIRRLEIAADDSVASDSLFLRYVGAGYGTIVGLAFGPDGLYFTDLYGEQGFGEDGLTRANIYRIRAGGRRGHVGHEDGGTNAEWNAPTLVQTRPSGLALPAAVLWDRANGRATIPFTLDRPALVSATLYDVTGRRVRSLLDRKALEGAQSLAWDGRGDAGERLGSGLYLLLFATDQGDAKTVRVILLR